MAAISQEYAEVSQRVDILVGRLGLGDNFIS